MTNNQLPSAPGKWDKLAFALTVLVMRVADELKKIAQEKREEIREKKWKKICDEAKETIKKEQKVIGIVRKNKNICELFIELLEIDLFSTTKKEIEQRHAEVLGAAVRRYQPNTRRWTLVKMKKEK